MFINAWAPELDKAVPPYIIRRKHGVYLSMALLGHLGKPSRMLCGRARSIGGYMWCTYTIVLSEEYHSHFRSLCALQTLHIQEHSMFGPGLNLRVHDGWRRTSPNRKCRSPKSTSNLPCSSWGTTAYPCTPPDVFKRTLASCEETSISLFVPLHLPARPARMPTHLSIVRPMTSIR